ncbi:MAG: ABC transporter ATP-binding protein [Desulfovibrio sp.]|uniref:ABC transporter ATP-binding protein n=1 Tax=Desulfovibrio sp. 7SRBS1 TaxID=3378064 RepID=UPI003B42225D
MTQPLIQLEGIRRDYVQGDEIIRVLKGIDLEIAQGEFVALQGTSGSGKSTLLHILGLLDRPTEGRYLLRGEDVSQLDDDRQSDMRNRFTGFVFQSFYLVPYASALENVLLPGLYSTTPEQKLRQRAAELLERVGLGDRKQFKPSQLSGGQQQRVALARALINDPVMVLADEPTGQLDSTTSREILELLDAINKTGTTVLIVTHDEETAAVAHRRVHIADGRIENQ